MAEAAAGDDEDIAASLLQGKEQAYPGRKTGDGTLMQFGMGQQQTQAEQARLQRASEAQNAIERDRLAQEERRTSLAERGATETEAARKKDIQESMNRGEDVGYRERVSRPVRRRKGLND